MDPSHQDFPTLDPIAKEISCRVPDLYDRYSELTADAMSFVLDPIRTGRTRLVELDNVEKTFVGLKVEHYLREALGAPKGVRDLRLAGHNVDVKNTVSKSLSWMIPPETYLGEEPCLLTAIDATRRMVSLGLIVARQSYLRRGRNRDSKLGIQAAARVHILWLIQKCPLPRDRWAGINMMRFRELRAKKGGTERAAHFFAENLRRPIHRSVVQSLLHDQQDYMKRLRDNGGAKTSLRRQKIALLSGTYFNHVLEELKIGRIGRDEHIAVDAQTPGEAEILRRHGQL